MSPQENQRLEAYARSLGKPVHQVRVGLDRALWEAGPIPVTDFADALECEGKYTMPPKEREQWEALGRFRDALTTFLEDKNVAFIGGVAVRTYGGRLTPTVDFDLLVERSFLKDITAFLEAQGGVLQGTVENTYSFFLEPCALDFDLRVAESALDKEELATANPAPFKGRRLQIVRAGLLAAMKVKACRERKDQPEGVQDRDDVRGLIRSGATTEFEIREILTRFRPDLLRELEEILT